MSENEDSTTRFTAFISDMTPAQFAVIQELQQTDFSTFEPEKTARSIYDQAVRSGIRSSVIHEIVKHVLKRKGIRFDAQKLNAQRWGAKDNWEKVGTENHPPPPPFVLDPLYFPKKGDSQQN